MVLLILFLSFLAPCCRSLAASLDISPVIIDYFYEQGCSDCIRVRNEIIPELKDDFDGFYVINHHDIGIESNVVKLVAYQEKLGTTENEPVCMVVDYQYVFNGFEVIKKGLFNRIDECVAERLSATGGSAYGGESRWKAPEPIIAEQIIEEDISILERRLKHFTVPAIAAAGLIDGINPCAIATLVFFMSVLAVAKVKGRALIVMGISFCLASFATYTAMGFGLLRVLYLFTGFNTLQLGVEIVMIVVLGVFAYLSFRDAYRYRQSRDPNEVTLQLPQKVKKKIHEIMRAGLNIRSLVLGGFFIGVVVTALESVCTGQVYVPTLVMIIKSGQSVSTAWLYLFLYNAMFIIPLVTVFILTYRGLNTETLIEWSKENVVPSKILFGCFFLVMAVLIGVV